MTAYRYVGDDERYYPALGITAKPGDPPYDLTDPPDDGRFELATKTPPRTSKTQE